ncbi:MAG: NADH-ubiquinone oxidoreductase-F iron-sulfur binding region domain-containing protein [Bacillota bacterium]
MTERVILGPYTPGKALDEALGMSRSDVVMTVRDSGLRGRGGAGFPTGTKWMLAAAAAGDEKYVICNADEGEPGTFKDRVLLDEYADLVFDGMVAAGYAVGSREGYVYLRGEYRYMLKDLEETLEKMRNEGRLGSNIGGREDFSFDIHIHLGSGAYVCGEESALIESMEGRRGEPRIRPPFPVTAGYLGKPTVVNNVETFALASRILEHGPEWFKGYGTDDSVGLKLYSVSGDVEDPGVYELPMGITVEELLDKVGGADAAAVQIGGASGSMVTRGDFGRRIAFEDIPTGGSVIVFGPQRDLLAVLENFMEFFADESCGQCTPCRLGTARLLEGVRDMRVGTIDEDRVEVLRDLADTMAIAAKCGLGQSCNSPFNSILDAHLEGVAR